VQCRRLTYLLDILTDYINFLYAPVRALHSSNPNLLTPVSIATASRAFWAAAPKVWNNLPLSVPMYIWCF